jgi:hypothetical protein
VTTHKRNPTSPLTRLPCLLFQSLSLCPRLLCQSIKISCSSCSRGACLTLSTAFQNRSSPIPDLRLSNHHTLSTAGATSRFRFGYRAPSHLEHATAFKIWSISLCARLLTDNSSRNFLLQAQSAPLRLGTGPPFVRVAQRLFKVKVGALYLCETFDSANPSLPIRI